MRSFLKELALISGIALAACAVGQTADNGSGNGAQAQAGRLMTWPDLLERPRPVPSATVH
jgi:hypothetical protein